MRKARHGSMLFPHDFGTELNKLISKQTSIKPVKLLCPRSAPIGVGWADVHVQLHPGPCSRDECIVLLLEVFCRFLVCPVSVMLVLPICRRMFVAVCPKLGFIHEGVLATSGFHAQVKTSLARTGQVKSLIATTITALNACTHFLLADITYKLPTPGRNLFDVAQKRCAHLELLITSIAEDNRIRILAVAVVAYCTFAVWLFPCSLQPLDILLIHVILHASDTSTADGRILPGRDKVRAQIQVFLGRAFCLPDTQRDPVLGLRFGGVALPEKPINLLRRDNCKVGPKVKIRVKLFPASLLSRLIPVAMRHSRRSGGSSAVARTSGASIPTSGRIPRRRGHCPSSLST
ncbi:hypothetical protein KCU88_g433, partial [Aureobasidium melanogenum]